MAFYTRDVERKQYSERCRFFFSCVKGAFARCPKLGGRGSELDSDEEDSLYDTEEDREMVILTIRARAAEGRTRRTGQCAMHKGFDSILSSTAGELFVAAKGMQHLESTTEQEEEEREAFFSVGSRCSSASREAFFSARSCLSRSSSTSKIELWELPRRSIFLEFSHCEGWPFGLYRKALLPPLPKCPSDSWSWNKRNKMMNKKP